MAEARERHRPGSQHGHPFEIPAEHKGDDHYSIFDQAIERIQRSFPDMLEADRHWYDVTLELAEAFFPPDDFYQVNYPDHPAIRFIAECLNSDPRLIDNCSNLFPTFEVEVRDSLLSEGAPYTGLYLPLYPGMTPQDLRDAASDIVAAINTFYASYTPHGRVLALRAQGLTHRRIAERLGLTEQTVAATLKGYSKGSLENA